MADRIALGKSFMADLLARVPEDQRATVAATLESSEEALALLGDGVLRQSDYSRAMNEVSAKHSELTTWYETNKAALDAAARAKTGDPAPQPAAIDMKAVEKFVAERERGVGAFVVATSDLAMKHFKEFGEPLALADLLADPNIEKVGLLGVYDAKYAPKYQEKREAAQKELVEKTVAERLTEERKKLITNPYPVTSHDPSPLDALEAPMSDHALVQKAADEYSVLVANRQRVGG